MNQKTLQLQVNGMTCQRCADTVQRALLGHGGVTSAAINLENSRVTVTYDPELTSPDDLIVAVQEEGYATRVLEPARSAE